MTEANANAYKDTSPNGLFAPDEYLTWTENGAFTLDWWNLHNGTDCSHVTMVEGATDCDDGGMLSSGASCEPPLNTPFAPYYGTQMITKLGAPGDGLVPATSSTSLISAHAVWRANGDVSGHAHQQGPRQRRHGHPVLRRVHPVCGHPDRVLVPKNATSIGSATTGSATRQNVPAYSIVVVQLHRQ